MGGARRPSVGGCAVGRGDAVRGAARRVGRRLSSFQARTPRSFAHLSAMFVSLAFFVAAAGSASAENIVINGFSFPVDSLVQAAGDQVAVRLGGKETLVAASGRDDFVVRETLGSTELANRFDSRALIRFADASLQGGRAVWAGLALRAARRRTDAADADLREALQVIVGADNRPDGLVEAIKIALLPVFEPGRYPLFTAALVLEGGIADPLWARGNIAPYLGALGVQVRALGEREENEALRLRRLERAAAIVAFFRECFGPAEPFVQRLAVRFERVSAVARGAAEGDIGVLGEAMGVEHSDRELASIAASLALEGLHAAASRELDANRPDQALRVLARVDPLKRTQTTHRLVAASLEALKPSAGAALERPDVRFVCGVVAENDAAAGESYRRALQAQIEFFAATGDVSKSEALLADLVRLQPEQTGVNDALRAAQVRAYLERGLLSIAAAKTAEIEGRPFLRAWLRLRIAIAGMSAAMFGFVLLLSGALLAVLGSSLFRSKPAVAATEAESAHAGRRGVSPEPPVGEDARSNDNDDEEAAPRGFVVNEIRRLSPAMQEYQRCLDTLGLAANADLKMIKNAYRKAVKDVHPDRQQTHDDAASTRFIELTQVYDRILELRKEFGCED